MGALLPARQGAQLELRIREANEAEQSAREACRKLRTSLVGGKRGKELAFDLDRLDAAASEFDRRTACISDAAARTGENAKRSQETARLQQSSRAMLALAAKVRHASPAAAIAMLDAWQ